MATGFPMKTSYLTGDVLAASDINDITGTVNILGNVVVNEQTGDYTLVLGDSAKVISMNKATANNLTVPPNSSVAFPTGTQLIVYQKGAGQTTLVAGSGVTINSNGTKLKLTGQYAVASLVKIDTNTWIAAGNLSA